MRRGIGALLVLTLVVAVAGFFGFRSRQRAERAVAWSSMDAASCPRALPLGAPCGPCVAASCCAQITACFDVADCIDLNDCWVTCGEDEGDRGNRASCPARCEKKHPGSVAVFRAWDDCVHAACEDVCPRESGE